MSVVIQCNKAIIKFIQKSGKEGASLAAIRTGIMPAVQLQPTTLLAACKNLYYSGILEKRGKFKDPESLNFRVNFQLRKAAP